MNKLDKIILSILAIEHLGFGIYGLYAPNSIAGLIGYELGSEFAYSEIRANYGMFTILGRILNYFITGDLATSIIVAVVAEAIVVGLCIWRLAANRQTAESIG